MKTNLLIRKIDRPSKEILDAFKDIAVTNIARAYASSERLKKLGVEIQ